MITYDLKRIGIRMSTMLISAWPSVASRADHPHLRVSGTSLSHSARRADRRISRAGRS